MKYGNRDFCQSRSRFRLLEKTNNQKTLKRIRELLESALETPFKGIGKPEPLKHNLSGKWSRRIDNEHRLVYEVANDTIIIHSLRGHY